MGLSARYGALVILNAYAEALWERPVDHRSVHQMVAQPRGGVSAPNAKGHDGLVSSGCPPGPPLTVPMTIPTAKFCQF